jgi:cytidine deaminase
MKKTYTECPSEYLTLAALAKAAQESAYAPYSNFKVGSAVEDIHGNYWSGCNIENSSYSLSLCAERVAVAKMVYEVGPRQFSLALIADSEEPSFPCGSCLQFLSEFGCLEVMAINKSMTLFEVINFDELLPHPFSAKNLKP